MIQIYRSTADKKLKQNKDWWTNYISELHSSMLTLRLHLHAVILDTTIQVIKQSKINISQVHSLYFMDDTGCATGYSIKAVTILTKMKEQLI